MKQVSATVFLVFVLGLANSLFAQFNDYIDEIRGDTAVVKSYADMNYNANSFIDAIASDTLENGERANPNRVYMLKRGRYYPQDRQYTYPDIPITVVGEGGPVVGGALEDGAPPLVYGTTNSQGEAQDGRLFVFVNNSVFKNISFSTAADNGAMHNWNFNLFSDNIEISFDKCLFEHTGWVIATGSKKEQKVKIKDSYFVNLNGFPCRRNGGVYDNVVQNTAEIYVENSTHMMAAGMVYKFRNFPIGHAYFNHNTFVNCPGLIFETFGNQVEWVVTNNLFVNSNCQAYYPGLDRPETDQDYLPTGIINVRKLEGMDTWFPDGFPEADRKILVDRNAVYWDPRLDTIIGSLKEDDGGLNKEWFSQMITMNTRTQNIFDNSVTYPLLNEGNWIKDEKPGFYQMDDVVDNIIAYCIDAVQEGNTTNLMKWRAPGNEITDENRDNMVYADWPLNCNLRYTNETLRSAGLSGFPVGDLNWFSYLKPTWDGQSDAEHAAIIAALNAGTSPEAQNVTIPPEFGVGIPPVSNTANYELKNTPNPFKSYTTISYKLPENGNAVLEVFDIQGKVIATLVNQLQVAGNYSVDYSAENLSSGVYLFSLSVNNIRVTKQMVVR
ncbi:MAG: T9SS type A sorting domain-containing protein [Bacteroidota bacterium]